MTDRFDVALIAATSRRDEAEEAIALAGGRLVAVLDWSDTGALMERSLAAQCWRWSRTAYYRTYWRLPGPIYG